MDGQDAYEILKEIRSLRTRYEDGQRENVERLASLETGQKAMSAHLESVSRKVDRGDAGMAAQVERLDESVRGQVSALATHAGDPDAHGWKEWREQMGRYLALAVKVGSVGTVIAAAVHRFWDQLHQIGGRHP